MHQDLRDAIHIPFARIFLDPNNPRIAPEERPGYENPDDLFSTEVQLHLNSEMTRAYDLDTLEESIVGQGWVPIDAILVWEHHKHEGFYIVVEGNRRTVVLRRIHARLDREKAKLAKMLEKPKKFAKSDLDGQANLVSKLEQIIGDTANLFVYPVNADTPEELEAKLPRLLGVRHVTHAQQWSPYATNLYILSLYQKLFEERHGPERDLALEPDLVAKVGSMVSLGSTKTRRNIQAARAFSHFRSSYDDKLSEGDEFTDEDHYYLENILQNKYAYKEFSFNQDSLFLDQEMEEVLFKWAFRFPRGDGDEGKNVLRKAEDIRLWARMAQYDNDKGTSFAKELDVNRPDDATPMRELEAKFLAHKAQVSPIDTVGALLDSLKKLNVETMLTQSSHLKPMIQELCRRGQEYLAMIDAAASVRAGKGSKHATT